MDMTYESRGLTDGREADQVIQLARLFEQYPRLAV